MIPTVTPIDKSVIAKIPGWFPPPDGLTQMKVVYGDITVRNGQIAAPRDWESDNMVMVYDLPAMPMRRLYCNKKIVPMLRDALAACVALNDGYKIRTLGCFAPRPKRVNGDLSVHSWGCAVDINAGTNPLYIGKPGPYDMPDAWVAEFEKRGWRWGGRFPNADFMHFQYVTGY